MQAGELEIRKTAFLSISSMAFLNYSVGTDFKYEQELVDKFKSPEFIPVLIKVFPTVLLVELAYIDYECIFFVQQR